MINLLRKQCPFCNGKNEFFLSSQLTQAVVDCVKSGCGKFDTLIDEMDITDKYIISKDLIIIVSRFGSVISYDDSQHLIKGYFFTVEDMGKLNELLVLL